MTLNKVFPLIDTLARGGSLSEEDRARLATVENIYSIGLDNIPDSYDWTSFLRCLAESCPKVERLELSNTGVTDLTPLAGLSKLEKLDLDNTGVTDLTPLAGLSKLFALRLNNTGVTDLTPLAGLSNLGWLYIRNLHLSEIPRALVSEWLHLFTDGATIVKQPPALFYLPTEQILSLYYDQEKVPVREGKVIFLGDSGVGKTHTIRRVLAHGADERFDIESTPGIDILPFACADETGTTINFWDFGGQQIMQAMHLCFLTERTCYVVVVSNREARSVMPQARRWLRTVAGFSGQVSVILAVNQWNNVSEENNLDEDELQALCPGLRVVYYSAKGGAAEDFNRDLTDTITDEVRRLDSVQLELPKSWAAIRAALMNSKENYISMGDYRALCEQHGLGRNSEVMESIRMWLLDWFNDMGVCFSYHKNAPTTQRELAEYKVLNPRWLTNGIYRIINNGLKFADAGCLTREDIRELLTGRDYLSVDASLRYEKPEEQLYILEVMRKFSRSYEQDDGREYIPELLPEKRPSKLLPDGLALAAVCELKLLYLPKSLIHRLMIELREWNDGAQWRFGVRLREKGSALVIESRDEEGVLSIEVFTDGETKVRALFHRARLLVYQYIREMGLRLEAELIEARKDGAVAQYSLENLVEYYYEDPNDKFHSTAGENKRFTFDELLLPLFPKELLTAAEPLSRGNLTAALNAVAAVYPYDTAETMEAVKRDKDWAKLLNEPMAERTRGLSRLSRLAMLMQTDSRLLIWLEKNGTRKQEAEEMDDQNLWDENSISVNKQLCRWALRSPLYRHAVGEVDAKALAKALGPNETERYQKSYELMKAVWKRHPELGLMPDYRFLSEQEHKGAYYSRYRDHLTHMFKVYLLGLYFYERDPALRDRMPEDFFPVWTMTALWHDIGYLIETEDGGRDSESAKDAIKRFNDILAVPMTKLFFDENYQDNELAQQSKKQVSPKKIRYLSNLEDKLSCFDGYGESVRLTLSPECNPIREYYFLMSQKRDGRVYYDHGIVSAALLLFLSDALCEYMEDSKRFDMLEERKAKRDAFLNQMEKFRFHVQQAAAAIALHNMTKDGPSGELNEKGVTISDFRISLESEPIAWLLRVCDETQCWDRQRFSSPLEDKPTLTGSGLHFENDPFRLTFASVGDLEKIKGALSPVLKELPDFLG